jgi:hypothetical protein
MKTVALILDPDFGQRLERIAQEMPVWILSSPSNDAAIEQARRSVKDDASITSYIPQKPEDRVTTCTQVLYDIDEHHGVWSSSDPYEELLVFGARPVEFSPEAMTELGLESAGTDENGLVLRKRRAARPATR